tara:strand:+ start:269 stop:580 length:312 start_codon:yes stop_codon:yes gene_type:complete
MCGESLAYKEVHISVEYILISLLYPERDSPPLINMRIVIQLDDEDVRVLKEISEEKTLTSSLPTKKGWKTYDEVLAYMVIDQIINRASIINNESKKTSAFSKI